MKTSKSYNGYANYNQWNQSLWINNDGGLYALAKDAIHNTDSRKEAVNYMLESLVNGCMMEETPDGVKWSKAGIRAALVGM